MTLTDKPVLSEKPFFDPGRTVFDLKQSPIQLEIDVGDAAKAKQYGQVLLTNLQTEGWKIGPSKFVMKVTTHVTESENEIEFLDGQRIRIPLVAYNYSLLDDGGRTLAEGQTLAGFDSSTTRYRTKVDLETRRITGDNAFDFGDKNPKVAILEEILETGGGITSLPYMPNEPRLFTNGEILKIPMEIN